MLAPLEPSTSLTVGQATDRWGSSIVFVTILEDRRFTARGTSLPSRLLARLTTRARVHAREETVRRGAGLESSVGTEVMTADRGVRRFIGAANREHWGNLRSARRSDLRSDRFRSRVPRVYRHPSKTEVIFSLPWFDRQTGARQPDEKQQGPQAARFGQRGWQGQRPLRWSRERI